MNYTYKYACTGIIFGTAFVFVAWVIELSITSLMATPSNIIQIHLDNPIIFIVDIAPLVLGVSFYYIGKVHQRLYSKSMKLQVIRQLIETRKEQESVANDLTQLIDTANAPVFGIDAAGLVNEWNQRAESITGFSKADVMGKDLVAEFITDDYKASVKGILDKALQGEESANYEFPLFTKTGDRVDVLLNSTSRRDAAGHIVGVVGVGQDITELNKIRKEQESVARDLTQLIDTANAPILGIDAAGLVNEWNQRAEQLTGFAKIDVMGKDLVAGFITDDYKASVKEVLDKALQGEESANYEFPLFTKTGDRVDVLLNSTSRRNAAGHIVGVVGVGQDITELNNIRLEQESVAHDLTQLIDTANAPIFGIDAAGLVNEWNQRAEQLTDFAKIDVMGKDLVAEFITDDYKDSVKKVLDKALQGEETANYQFPLYTRSGDRVDVLLNSTSRRNSNGTIVGVVGVGHDITALNQIRREQESVANDLTQLIDTANAPIFGIDATGLVNEWNQRTESITGFNKVDVMGKDLVAEFITDDYKVSVKEVLHKALKSEETANFKLPLYTKANERVIVLLNATTRRNANGDVVGVIGVGQDITELDRTHMNMETQVKERTRDLDALLTLSPDGFLFVNSNNNIVYINPALLSMTGFNQDQLVGKTIDDFSELMENLFDSKKMSNIKFIHNEDGEQLLYLSRPTLRVIKYNHRTMLGSTDEKEGQVLYFRDVTHETDVDNMKSDFLSTAAHELRTPLASIYGLSELLIIRDYDKNKSDEMIKTIFRQAHNLKKLIDELLDLSRIESRSGKCFSMAIGSLEYVVRQTCVEVEGAFFDRKVEIQRLDFWPVLSFDIDKIRQVIRNLLSNGFKYSPENTHVIVQTRERKKSGYRQFGISIIDQGIGMTPEQLTHIGERFYRADDSGSTPGSGLGISLVKEIMSYHNGEVEFFSVSGEGMTATVWFPNIVN
jgi:PAS domain S-box-containing protein